MESRYKFTQKVFVRNGDAWREGVVRRVLFDGGYDYEVKFGDTTETITEVRVYSEYEMLKVVNREQAEANPEHFREMTAWIFEHLKEELDNIQLAKSKQKRKFQTQSERMVEVKLLLGKVHSIINLMKEESEG